MAEKNKKKLNSLIERLVSIAESVSEENYEDENKIEEQADETAEIEQPEVAVSEAKKPRDFFDFESEYDPEDRYIC